jgi:protein O-mannosyl-transferase
MSKRSGKAKKQNWQEKPVDSSIKSHTTKPMDKNAMYAALALILFTFATYSLTLKFDFVNWDDDKNIYENPLVRDINKDNFWKNTKEIFKTDVIGGYNPLTVWTFALESRYIGIEKPGRWHLNNVLLHIICVCLVFRISLLLGLSWRGAVFVAGLFALHPMRVESVAWITERKDVLFGAFYLAALMQYIQYKSDQKTMRWWWIGLFFLLSLFSKIQAVSLPLSMMAVDYLMDKKWQFKSIMNKIPFFAGSLLFGILGFILLKEAGTIGDGSNAAPYSQIDRLFVGSYSYLVYLVKLIYPYKMVPMYPYAPSMPAYFYPSILIAPAVLGIMWYAHKKEWKEIVFAFLFFTFNVMFVLQIVGAGQGFLADRFTYIPYFGFFFLAGYYLEKIIDKKSKYRTMAIGLALAYLGFSGIRSFQQTKIWENGESIWTHVMGYYPNTTLPYGNRANYYRNNNMREKALEDYNMAIKLKPNAQTYNSRARLFFDLSNSRDSLMLALEDYNKAIEMDPGNGEFHVNRGATWARLGNFEKAMEDINQGLVYKPDHAVGYLNRSVLNNNIGNTREALTDLEKYVEFNQNNADIWYEIARARRILNMPPDTYINEYTKAIRLNPNKGLFYHERGTAYFQMGKKWKKPAMISAGPYP